MQTTGKDRYARYGQTFAYRKARRNEHFSVVSRCRCHVPCAAMDLCVFLFQLCVPGTSAALRDDHACLPCRTDSMLQLTAAGAVLVAVLSLIFIVILVGTVVFRATIRNAVLKRQSVGPTHVDFVEVYLDPDNLADDGVNAIAGLLSRLACCRLLCSAEKGCCIRCQRCSRSGFRHLATWFLSDLHPQQPHVESATRSKPSDSHRNIGSVSPVQAGQLADSNVPSKLGSPENKPSHYLSDSESENGTGDPSTNHSKARTLWLKTRTAVGARGRDSDSVSSASRSMAPESLTAQTESTDAAAADELGKRERPTIASRLKVLLAFVHLSGTFIDQYHIPFPSIVSKIASFFSVFNVSIFTFVSFSCAASAFDQFDRLLFMTLAPLAVISLLLCYYYVLWQWTMPLSQRGPASSSQSSSSLTDSGSSSLASASGHHVELSSSQHFEAASGDAAITPTLSRGSCDRFCGPLKQLQAKWWWLCCCCCWFLCCCRNSRFRPPQAAYTSGSPQPPQQIQVDQFKSWAQWLSVVRSKRLADWIVPNFMRSSADRIVLWRARVFHLALYASFLCLPTVSSEIAKCYRCIIFDDGTEFLAADLSIVRCPMLSTFHIGD